ncbi:hypothetical protein [Nocardia nova]|uniref:hypothetical protein n=1 Tax=Nocardia nova TaxID=37330 RepID=UPI0015E31F8D|nr:hypothetical protein [Nocardia nova]
MACVMAETTHTAPETSRRAGGLMAKLSGGRADTPVSRPLGPRLSDRREGLVRGLATPLLDAAIEYVSATAELTRLYLHTDARAPGALEWSGGTTCFTDLVLWRAALESSSAMTVSRQVLPRSE